MVLFGTSCCRGGCIIAVTLVLPNLPCFHNHLSQDIWLLCVTCTIGK
jgi:hypothetical protein